MKYLLPLSALIVAAAVQHATPARAAAPDALVRQAVAAEGGADALRALKRLSITAEATEWEEEQSEVADGPPRHYGNSTLTVRWDLDKGMARTDVDHTMLYPFPGQEKYSVIVTPAAGTATYDKGQRAMSPVRLAFDLRELERVSPALLLKALDAPKKLTALPDQKFEGKSLPAVAFVDGAIRFTILFDPKTHLPAVIRTIEDDETHGDGHYDVALSDWKSVGGAALAYGLHYTFNGMDKIKVAYKDVTANPTFADDMFAIDDAVRQAAKPPATGDVPWQTVLGRENSGRYDDLQAEKDAAEGPVMKLAELSTNVQQALGRSHNSLIVAMKDYLVVFDAPIDEAQSRWTIDAAKQKYPGKPIKYLVLTHHHFDHVTGARTYVAEGATVIVGKPDKAHMEKLFRAMHTMHPDALQLHPRKAAVVEVGDRMTLKDGDREIRLFRIANPHAQGMLIGYVLPDKILWVTDLYSPGRDKARTPNNTDFYATVKQLGLEPERYAGGHGSSGTQAEFDAIMAQDR